MVQPVRRWPWLAAWRSHGQWVRDNKFRKPTRLLEDKTVAVPTVGDRDYSVQY
jgi:hypothetical protein